MKQEWEKYWDDYRFPDSFMRSDIEPFGNPVRVMIADACKIGDSVLDVGCASCISYPLFEDTAYVGMDFTFPFLKVARKLYGDVQVVHGYALSLPFSDGAFDSVFLKDVLEHVGEGAYKAIIGEMWRVAKKQIIIALYGGMYEDRETVYKTIREPDEHNVGVPPYKGGIYYFNIYARKDIVTCVEALPNLAGYHIKDDVPLENTTANIRTLILVRKTW